MKNRPRHWINALSGNFDRLKLKALQGLRPNGESSVLLLMSAVFVLVVMLGIMVYLRLANTLSDVRSEIQGDRTQMLTKSVMADINLLENNARAYALTRDEELLDQFYVTADTLNDKILDLGKTAPDSLALQTDFLRKLTQKKIELYVRLIEVSDEFRIENTISRIQQDAGGNPVVQSDKGQRKSFSNRIRQLLGKFKKENDLPANDKAADKSRTPSYSDIHTILTDAELQEKKRRDQEMEIYREDGLIMKEIRSIIARIEAADAAEMEAKIDKAEEGVGFTRFLIICFSILLGGVVILGVWVFTKYSMSNKAAQKALGEAKEEAEQLGEARSRFVANVTHEIRTPLHAIKGFTEQILQTPLTKGQREQLQMVSKATSHLSELVNDVLDFSKLRADKFALHPGHFKLRLLIDEVVGLIRSQILGEEPVVQSEISAEVPEWLFGDSLRLRQMLLNVMGNAVKFTRKGSIALNVRPSGTLDDAMRLVFEIKDTGMGIAPEHLDRVFDEFEQVGVSHTRMGSGLGLPIVKKMAEMHGGSVSLHSKLGEGTTIYLELPYRIGVEIHEHHDRKWTVPKEWLQGKHLLVVDDEPFNRSLLEAMLEKTGALVDQAASGDEALVKAVEIPYDLIFMDIMMPGRSGVETMKMLKQHGFGTDVNGQKRGIWAVTAAVDAVQVDKYKNEGFDYVLVKPFGEQDLWKAITLYFTAEELSAEPEDLAAEDSAEKNEHPKPEQRNGKRAAVSEAESREEELPAVAPEGKLLNTRFLFETGNDDPAFVMEMLQLFYDSTSESLVKFRAFWKAGDLKQLADEAHKMCPSYRHMGAPALVQILKAIEWRGRSGQKDAEMERLVKEADHQIERSLEECRELMHSQVS